MPVDYTKKTADLSVVEALGTSFGELAANCVVKGYPAGYCKGLTESGKTAFVIFVAFNPSLATVTAVETLCDDVEDEE